MKIKELNITVVDLSESSDADISIDSKMFEEMLQKFEKKLNSMIEKGVTQIEELNLSLVDGSESTFLKIQKNT